MAIADEGTGIKEISQEFYLYGSEFQEKDLPLVQALNHSGHILGGAFTISDPFDSKTFRGTERSWNLNFFPDMKNYSWICGDYIYPPILDFGFFMSDLLSSSKYKEINAIVRIGDNSVKAVQNFLDEINTEKSFLVRISGYLKDKP